MRRTYLLIASAVLALDQIAKWLVAGRFSFDTSVTVIPGLFSLVRVENRGVAFGMLSGASSGLALTVIILVSVVALGVICYLLWKNDASAWRTGIALALILGGATGNLIDRIARGRVVDFLDFYFRDYHWPAFNVADSAIVVGAGLLIIDLFWGRVPQAPPRHESASN
jgi:signal peptidase II